MEGTSAARLSDPIAHTNAHARFWAKFAGGLVGGIVVGAMAGAAAVAIIGTGGAAAPLVAAAAVGVARFGGGMIGGMAGEWVADKLVPETVTVTGMISTASTNVFINSKTRGATRASADVPVDMVLCSKHSPPIYVAEGSKTVYVNTWNMSRKDDKTTCGAKISEGSADVIVGGPTARVREVADEVPFISKAIVTLLSVAMLARGLRCLPKLARQGKAALPCLVGGAVSAGIGVWGLASSLGNPVMAATGGKVLGGDADLDFVLPGPIPLAWQRCYSSHDVRTDSMLGQGWCLPFAVELVVGLNSKGEAVATLFDQQGRDIEFPQLDSGTGVFSQSEGYWLWRSEGGRYFSQSIDGEYWVFEPPAEGLQEQRLKLQRVEDRNANFIELRWNALRQLHQITDSTGRLLALTYDAAARLVEVSIVTAAPDEIPGVLVRYGYDNAGQLAQVHDRSGQQSRRFAYNADRLMTLHADAAGLECRYEWQGQGRWARVVRHWTNDGESYDVSYRLFSDQLPDDSLAPSTVAGETTAVDQLGRVQSWRWNGTFRVLGYTNPMGATWLAAYDEFKQLLSLTEPNGARTTYGYDELGLQTTETDALGRTWSTSWTPLGQPWMDTAPDGSADHFFYDDNGNLTRHTAADGSETYFVHDKRGLPLRITDAKGGIKRLSWSVRAQLLEYTDCSAQTTRYAYDGQGHLSRVADAQGNVTEFTHDASGNLRGQSLPDGAHQSFDWDVASRLIQSRDALSRSTRFEWNLRGQLTNREDAEGRRVDMEYDNARRLSRLTNENGESFAFEYNVGDQLVAEHRIGGQRVTVEYDVAGWPVAVTHYPALGDDMLFDGGERTAGHTPEIAGWGDEHAAPSSAAGPKPRRTELLRDAAGRLLEKRTGAHCYSYQYDLLDRLTSAVKQQRMHGPEGESLKPLHTTTFVYDALGRLIAETAHDHSSGTSHTLRHQHDVLGNRTQTQLPSLAGSSERERALNYLYYGSGHLHQINYQQRESSKPDAIAVHQLICDIERDSLHQEILRTQGKVQTRYAYDPVGRMTGAWSQSSSVVSQSFGAGQAGEQAWQKALDGLSEQLGSARSTQGNGLIKAWRYDKVGELRASRHSLRGDTGHQYDATGRILQTQHAPLAGVRNPLPQAANESFGYDPAGNIQDGATQQLVNSSTALSQRGYVRDNLVRVFEDKRYFYDGHARLICKLSGKHTDQRFVWDADNNLTEVRTTRRPGTEHATTQITRFDYDAIGRRVAKHDSFGTTTFIWEGMRLIEERRGSAVISYVYEPGSYVPLARLDADGEATQAGGLGTQDDPTPNETKAAVPTTSGTAANDSLEAKYWEALNASASASPSQRTGTDDGAKLCNVYYFHADQVGMPQELTNEQGQLVWQASYKTWGATVSEEWEIKTLAGNAVHSLDVGDGPDEPEQQQNLRFQGQYLDRDTGLHYNTFRYYDADVGRFICPDPIGLQGGINLGSYSPNPLMWIDPWGWACMPVRTTKNGTKIYGKGQKDGTVGHDTNSEKIATRLANTGLFKEIYLNRSYKVAGVGGSTRRPDVLAIDKKGNVHAIELASKTDMSKSKYPLLTSRNQTAQGTLNNGRNGTITVIDHPYSVRGINDGIRGAINNAK